MAKILSIPTSILVTVADDFDLEDEDALMDAVFEQNGKYIEVDARNLGYDQVVELG